MYQLQAPASLRTKLASAESMRTENGKVHAVTRALGVQPAVSLTRSGRSYCWHTPTGSVYLSKSAVPAPRANPARALEEAREAIRSLTSVDAQVMAVAAIFDQTAEDAEILAHSGDPDVQTYRWVDTPIGTVDLVTGGQSAQVYTAHVPGMPQNTMTAYDRLGAPYPTEGEAAQDTRFFPEREAHHRTILGDVLDARPGEEAPVAIVMMGGPASGKSGVVKMFEQAGGFAVLDADKFKEELPEFRHGISEGSKDAASSVHTESVYLLDVAFDRAIKARMNFVLDGMGKNPEGVATRIRRLKAAGYAVKLVYVRVEARAGLNRGLKRAAEKGRYIPEWAMEDAYAKVPKNFAYASRGADSYSVYDTSPRPGRPEGFPALEITSKRDGQVTVYDTDLFETLIAEQSGPVGHMLPTQYAVNPRRRSRTDAELDRLIRAGLQADTGELDMDRLANPRRQNPFPKWEMTKFEVGDLVIKAAGSKIHVGLVLSSDGFSTQWQMVGSSWTFPKMGRNFQLYSKNVEKLASQGLITYNSNEPYMVAASDFTKAAIWGGKNKSSIAKPYAVAMHYLSATGVGVPDGTRVVVAFAGGGGTVAIAPDQPKVASAPLTLPAQLVGLPVETTIRNTVATGVVMRKMHPTQTVNGASWQFVGNDGAVTPGTIMSAKQVMSMDHAWVVIPTAFGDEIAAPMAAVATPKAAPATSEGTVYISVYDDGTLIVSGDTYPAKGVIKDWGYKWSGKYGAKMGIPKQVWYLPKSKEMDAATKNAKATDLKGALAAAGFDYTSDMGASAPVDTHPTQVSAIVNVETKSDGSRWFYAAVQHGDGWRAVVVSTIDDDAMLHDSLDLPPNTYDDGNGWITLSSDSVGPKGKGFWHALATQDDDYDFVPKSAIEGLPQIWDIVTAPVGTMVWDDGAKLGERVEGGWLEGGALFTEAKFIAGLIPLLYLIDVTITKPEAPGGTKVGDWNLAKLPVATAIYGLDADLGWAVYQKVAPDQWKMVNATGNALHSGWALTAEMLASSLAAVVLALYPSQVTSHTLQWAAGSTKNSFFSIEEHHKKIAAEMALGVAADGDTGPSVVADAYSGAKSAATKSKAKSGDDDDDDSPVGMSSLLDDPTWTTLNPLQISIGDWHKVPDHGVIVGWAPDLLNKWPPAVVREENEFYQFYQAGDTRGKYTTSPPFQVDLTQTQDMQEQITSNYPETIWYYIGKGPLAVARAAMMDAGGWSQQSNEFMPPKLGNPEPMPKVARFYEKLQTGSVLGYNDDGDAVFWIIDGDNALVSGHTGYTDSLPEVADLDGVVWLVREGKGKMITSATRNAWTLAATTKIELDMVDDPTLGATPTPAPAPSPTPSVVTDLIHDNTLIVDEDGYLWFKTHGTWYVVQQDTAGDIGWHASSFTPDDPTLIGGAVTLGTIEQHAAKFKHTESPGNKGKAIKQVLALIEGISALDAGQPATWQSDEPLEIGSEIDDAVTEAQVPIGAYVLDDDGDILIKTVDNGAVTVNHHGMVQGVVPYSLTNGTTYLGQTWPSDDVIAQLASNANNNYVHTSVSMGKVIQLFQEAGEVKPSVPHAPKQPGTQAPAVPAMPVMTGWAIPSHPTWQKGVQVKLAQLVYDSVKPGGSTKGGIYTDKLGDKFLVKFQDGARAYNEVVAAAMYRGVGVWAPDVRMGMVDGKVATAGPWEAGLASFAPKLQHPPTTLGNWLAASFVVDVWLANWDVVGADYDNLVRKSTGYLTGVSTAAVNTKPFAGWPGGVARIDVGGAMAYRAQGAKKSASDWGANAVYSYTQMLSSGTKVKSVFGKFAGSAQSESAKLLHNTSRAEMTARLASIDWMQVWELFGRLAPNSSVYKASGVIDDLYHKLLARSKSLIAKWPASTGPSAVSPAEVFAVPGGGIQSKMAGMGATWEALRSHLLTHMKISVANTKYAFGGTSSAWAGVYKVLVNQGFLVKHGSDYYLHANQKPLVPTEGPPTAAEKASESASAALTFGMTIQPHNKSIWASLPKGSYFADKVGDVLKVVSSDNAFKDHLVGRYLTAAQELASMEYPLGTDKTAKDMTYSPYTYLGVLTQGQLDTIGEEHAPEDGGFWRVPIPPPFVPTKTATASAPAPSAAGSMDSYIGQQSSAANLGAWGVYPLPFYASDKEGDVFQVTAVKVGYEGDLTVIGAYIMAKDTSTTDSDFNVATSPHEPFTYLGTNLGKINAAGEKHSIFWNVIDIDALTSGAAASFAAPAAPAASPATGLQIGAEITNKAGALTVPEKGWLILTGVGTPVLARMWMAGAGGAEGYAPKGSANGFALGTTGKTYFGYPAIYLGLDLNQTTASKFFTAKTGKLKAGFEISDVVDWQYLSWGVTPSAPAASSASSASSASLSIPEDGAPIAAADIGALPDGSLLADSEGLGWAMGSGVLTGTDVDNAGFSIPAKSLPTLAAYGPWTLDTLGEGATGGGLRVPEKSTVQLLDEAPLKSMVMISALGAPDWGRIWLKTAEGWQSVSKLGTLSASQGKKSASELETVLKSRLPKKSWLLDMKAAGLPDATELASWRKFSVDSTEAPAGTELVLAVGAAKVQKKRRPVTEDGRKIAAGLLVFSGDYVLLAQRSQSISSPGTWGIPGGAVEAGESVLQAATRETEEELGGLPPMQDTGVRLTVDYDSVRYVTVVMKAATSAAATWRPNVGTASHGAETQGFAWVPRKELHNEGGAIVWRPRLHAGLGIPSQGMDAVLAVWLEQAPAWKKAAADMKAAESGGGDPTPIWDAVDYAPGKGAFGLSEAKFWQALESMPQPNPSGYTFSGVKQALTGTKKKYVEYRPRLPDGTRPRIRLELDSVAVAAKQASIEMQLGVRGDWMGVSAGGKQKLTAKQSLIGTAGAATRTPRSKQGVEIWTADAMPKFEAIVKLILGKSKVTRSELHKAAVLELVGLPLEQVTLQAPEAVVAAMADPTPMKALPKGKGGLSTKQVSIVNSLYAATLAMLGTSSTGDTGALDGKWAEDTKVKMRSALSSIKGGGGASQTEAHVGQWLRWIALARAGGLWPEIIDPGARVVYTGTYWSVNNYKSGAAMYRSLKRISANAETRKALKQLTTLGVYAGPTDLSGIPSVANTKLAGASFTLHLQAAAYAWLKRQATYGPKPPSSIPSATTDSKMTKWALANYQVKNAQQVPTWAGEAWANVDGFPIEYRYTVEGGDSSMSWGSAKVGIFNQDSFCLRANTADSWGFIMVPTVNMDGGKSFGSEYEVTYVDLGKPIPAEIVTSNYTGTSAGSKSTAHTLTQRQMNAYTLARPPYGPDWAQYNRYILTQNPRRANGRRAPSAETTVIQTVLFDLNDFSVADAAHWLSAHGYQTPAPDVTARYARFRQHQPEDFYSDTFRTITLDDGVKAVVAVPRAGRRLASK